MDVRDVRKVWRDRYYYCYYCYYYYYYCYYYYYHYDLRVGTKFSRFIKRGVQWKQGVMIYMMLYSLLYDTTPVHRAPLPLHPPVMNTQVRRRLNGYLAQRAPSLSLASSFGTRLNCAVLKCMFPWRTRYVPFKLGTH